MKAVLLSIQPKWCRLIAEGKKTVEVRKTIPKLETPFKCYIYCTQGKTLDDILTFAEYKNGEYMGDYYANGEIIGEFICRGIEEYWFTKEDADIEEYEDVQLSCLTSDEILAYGKEKPLYFWDISNLVIYDTPKELSEFAVIDERAIKGCRHRERVYVNPAYTNGAWLLGAYICTKGEEDWCSKCKTKPLKRPPQSWCYVEELEGKDENTNENL